MYGCRTIAWLWAKSSFCCWWASDSRRSSAAFLGYSLQRRAWREQQRARLFETERDAARAVFEELSRIFDRRLHRMRQLDASLAASSQAGDVERAVGRYREVVDEWNDNLNRMLALVQRYFGKSLRDELDYGLMTRFVETGALLQDRVRDHRTRAPSSSSPPSRLQPAQMSRANPTRLPKTPMSKASSTRSPATSMH
jgi:hypothetical protein